MFGATLAGEAARTMARMTFEKDAPVKVKTEKVTLRLRNEADDRQPPTLGLGSGEWWDKIYVNEAAEVSKLCATQTTRDAEIQAIRIGPLSIVANGGELFCQPGLNIKAASPMNPTWVVTLANEYLGYVPTASSFMPAVMNRGRRDRVPWRRILRSGLWKHHFARCHVYEDAIVARVFNPCIRQPAYECRKHGLKTRATVSTA